MYQVFNSGKMAMVPTGPWQLPEITESKVDYGVVPMPTFNGKPVTISGPDTWMVFDNGDARKAAAHRVRPVARRSPRRTRAGTSRRAACRCASRRSSSRSGSRRCSDTPGLKVFVDELAQRARAPGDARLSEDQPGASGSRSSPCCSARRRRRTRCTERRRGGNTALVDLGALESRRGRAGAAAGASPSARRARRCASACSARRRARGCSSRPRW